MAIDRSSATYRGLVKLFHFLNEAGIIGFFKRYPSIYRPIHRMIVDATRTRGLVNYGVVSNRHMVATIDAYGILANLYWPSIGEKEHVHRMFAGLGIRHSKKEKGYKYTPPESWTVNSRYAPRGLVLRTETRNPHHGVNMLVRDFVDIESDVVVREYFVQNRKQFEKLEIIFAFAEDMYINEDSRGDIIECVRESDCILHGKDDAWFAIGADAATSNMELGKTIEELLGISTAVRQSKPPNAAFTIDLGELSPGRISALSVFVCAGKTRKEALSSLSRSRALGSERMRVKSVDWWEAWRPGARGLALRGTRKRLFEASAKVMGALFDDRYGSIIASPIGPDMPDYRYVWPRDGTYVAVALDLLGKHEGPRAFYEHLFGLNGIRTDGRLEQRYRSDWTKAPTFGVQVDQMGTVLWGAWFHYLTTKDDAFIRKNWLALRALANAIMPSSDGLPPRSVDLWEEYKSNHVYALASSFGGLTCAHALSSTLGEDDDQAMKWRDACVLMRVNVEKFWSNDGFFIKSLNPRIDHVDTSALGLSIPFGMLSVDDDRMVSTAKRIEERLKFSNGGIGRFEHDGFYGGNPWIITTLWLGLYHAARGEEERARSLLGWVESSALTDSLLLPEQIDRDENTPVAAVPLNWSHAMYVISVFALNGHVPFVEYQGSI